MIVQANATETITDIVAAGGFGYVGVSGAVGVTILNVTTQAVIGNNASINNANPGSANGNQSVYVNASDNFDMHVYVIGVAGGFVGVTGAINVGTLADNVLAEIQTGANVRAKNNVDVYAGRHPEPDRIRDLRRRRCGGRRRVGDGLVDRPEAVADLPGQQRPLRQCGA